MVVLSNSFRLLLLLILAISFSLLSGCIAPQLKSHDDPNEPAIVKVSNIQNETFDGNLTIWRNNSTELNRSLTVGASNVTELTEIPPPQNPPETYHVEVRTDNWTATGSTTESKGFDELVIVLEGPEDIMVLASRSARV